MTICDLDMQEGGENDKLFLYEDMDSDTVLSGADEDGIASPGFCHPLTTSGNTVHIKWVSFSASIYSGWRV